MQIHELSPFTGTPGPNDFLAIDNGSETTKIGASDLLGDWFGTSNTSAAVATKTVVLPGFKLKTGARIAVKFSNNNTATRPSLNVNSTGAISIKTRTGGTASLAGLWQAGAVVMFIYDGTNWIVDNATIGNGVLVVSKSGVTSLTTNIDHDDITSRHVVLNAVLSNPSAQTEDWIVTTSNGRAQIGPAGAISGSTDITLVLGYQTNA